MNLILRRSTAAAVFLAIPVLSSCGFDRPTDRVYNPGVGVNNRAGSVDVLGAVIVSASAGTGTVSATFVNNDANRPDAVTGISGSGASSSVSVNLDKPLRLDPGGSARLSADTATTAEGDAVKPGAFVELRFSFRRSENVTIKVPVVARRGDYANVPTSGPSSPTASGLPSESPSESPTPSPGG